MPDASNRGKIPEGYCHWLSNFFFVHGLDRDDLAQEARLAAWLAPEGAQKIAARRRVLDLIKHAQRRPTYAELATEPVSWVDVVEVVERRERLRTVLEAPLSQLERRALGRVMRGENVSDKSTENALARARRKLAA